MISLDTNLLLYALDPRAPEHEPARAFLEECGERSDVAIAELVLVELYLLLRNPAVYTQPLSAPDAVETCQSFRRHPRWALIESAEVMSEVWARARREGVARRHIFDARLALTLRRNGVRELATRNVRDFEGFGFDRVFDPLTT
ncbi:MAG: TA system VapC family ribonuclease toxin [Thermoanaerobaculia bacterium]|nr:TA system VapC family ribonuclease toxin [Thermoanaerobaculia bacterium]